MKQISTFARKGEPRDDRAFAGAHPQQRPNMMEARHARKVTMSSVVELSISTGTSKYTPDSPQWRREVADLHNELHRGTGAVQEASIPVPGTKGGFVDVVLALGTSGALVAAVEIFRAWLGRDKTRELTVVWTDEDGKEKRFTVTGKHIDQRSFEALSESIGRMIEGR